MRELLLFHIYSGQLFFTAAFLFLLAAVVDHPRVRIAALLSVALGAFSGAPLPVLIWVPAVVFAIALQMHRLKPVLHTLSRVSAIVIVIVAVAYELRYHVGRPALQPPTRLMVIGDSLSSGGFGEKTTWPALLGAINLSSPSDTAAGALSNQIPQLPPPVPADLVIVEIGGNDMLDGTPANEYEHALDALLKSVKGRQTLMLELPIIPGRWRYGAIQRRVAAKNDVPLAPKRILARVLTDPRNTSDGLHLTQQGHAALAGELQHYLAKVINRPL